MSMRSTGCKIRRGIFLAALLLSLCMGTAAAAADRGIASIPQGLSADDAMWRECTLGDYVADAIRFDTGAQIALLPSGLLQGALVGDGVVTEEDVADLFTADRDVYVLSLSGPELKALLEDSVSRWRLTERETLDGEASAYGGFLQISGIEVTADATAAPGDRIVTVTMDGETLDLTDAVLTVTAAIPEPPEPGAAAVRQEKGLVSMTRGYIAAQGTVEAPETGRLRVIGAHERDIISVIPAGFFALLLVVLAANYFLTKSRRPEDGGA